MTRTALVTGGGSGIGAAVLANATTGVNPRDLAVSLIEGDPDADDDRPPPWRPTVALPAEVLGVPGLWFWGNTAYDVRWHNDGLELRAMARGLSNDEIAQQLVVGRATVKTHVSNVLLKTGARDRVHAIIWAFEHGVAGR